MQTKNAKISFIWKGLEVIKSKAKENTFINTRNSFQLREVECWAKASGENLYGKGAWRSVGGGRAHTGIFPPTILSWLSFIIKDILGSLRDVEMCTSIKFSKIEWFWAPATRSNRGRACPKPGWLDSDHSSSLPYSLGWKLDLWKIKGRQRPECASRTRHRVKECQAQDLASDHREFSLSHLPRKSYRVVTQTQKTSSLPWTQESIAAKVVMQLNPSLESLCLFLHWEFSLRFWNHALNTWIPQTLDPLDTHSHTLGQKHVNARAHACKHTHRHTGVETHTHTPTEDEGTQNADFI